MNNKDKNRELLSRRDFFRKAAINTLPFIAAIAVPPIFTACSSEPIPTPSGCDGCSSTCEGSCDKSCSGSCEGSCAGSNSNSGASCSDCSSSCKDTCSNTCSDSCKGSSTGENKTEFVGVDLGLSVLWATFNLGVARPYEVNDGYYWADSTGKATSDEIKKIINEKFPFQENKEYNISNSEYDIAKIQLGNGWRLPTKKEIEELITLCNGTFETKENTKGVCLKGNNGNSIFLPYEGNTDFYMSGEIAWWYLEGDKTICYKVLAISDEKQTISSANLINRIEKQKILSRILVRPVKDGGSGCSDCASGCTTACSKNCTGGCKETCENGCKETCENQCKETCKTTCSETCSGGCKEGCKNTCKTTCQESCKDSCKNTCGSGCSTECTGGCKTGCSGGCKSGCSGGCQTGCSDSCKDQCKGNCSSYCAVSCSNDCSGGCRGGCLGSCEYSCQNTCTGQCTTGCGGSCGFSCSFSCGNTCHKTAF